MKKTLLLAAVALMTATAAVAQTANGKLHEFDGTYLSDEGGFMRAGYFQHVSANGKYAVGTDDALDGTAFFWTDETPEDLYALEPYPFWNAATEQLSMYCMAFDVTDDGTIVGSATDANGIWYPAYKPKDEGWVLLPVPQSFDFYMGKYRGDVLTGVHAVTPDGQYMAGVLYLAYAEPVDVMGQMIAPCHLKPVIWKKNSRGRYDIVNTFEDVDKIKTFMVYDISNDGQTVVGMNTAGIGGQNPAILRDGKLYEIADCGEEGDENGNVGGGICLSVDPDGNIYGYYDNDAFIVPANADLSIMQAKDYNYSKMPKEWKQQTLYSCGYNDGKVDSRSYGMYGVLDVCADGTVAVGGTALDMKWGVIEIPAVWVSDSHGTGVKKIELDHIIKADGTVYSLTGQRINPTMKGVKIVGGKKVIR